MSGTDPTKPDPIGNTGLTVTGGTVNIGNAAWGTNPVAIRVGSSTTADDGTPIDIDALRRATADLSTVIRDGPEPVDGEAGQLLGRLQVAVAEDRPRRAKALEILGRLADGAGAGGALAAAVGAVLAALGAG